MKKWLAGILAALLVALACVLALAGCAPSTPREQIGLDPDEINVRPEGTEIRVKLRVGILPDTTEQILMNKWINAFIKVDPTVEITTELINADYKTAMLQYAQGKNWPDIVWTAGDQHSPFSSAGNFLKLTDYFYSDDELDPTDLYEIILDATHYSNADRDIWFAPRDYNKVTCYVNVDMFEAAGIALPDARWTWHDFEEICRQFRAKMDANVDPKSGLYEYSYPVAGDLSWGPISIPLLQSMGGTVYDGRGAVVVNSEAGRDWMDKIYQFTMRDRYAQPCAESGDIFDAKQAAMLLGVRPDLANLKEVKFRIDALPFPNFTGEWEDGYVGVGCSGYAVAASTTHPDDCWAFLKYILSVEGQQVGARTGLIAPVRKSMADDPSFTQFAVNGRVVSAAPFVTTAAQDLGLNYVNVKDPRIHADIRETVQGVLQTTSFDSFDLDKAMAVLERDLKNLE